jgi:hypothetical protein
MKYIAVKSAKMPAIVSACYLTLNGDASGGSGNSSVAAGFW